MKPALQAPLVFKKKTETGGNATVTETSVLTLWGALISVGTTPAGLQYDADYRFEADYVKNGHGIQPDMFAYFGTRRFIVRHAPDTIEPGPMAFLLRELVAQS